MVELADRSAAAGAIAAELTEEQEQVIAAVAEWLERRPRERMTVGGLAGTGKTTVAGQLPERLGIPRARVAYCAFTGKAASRLPDGRTIHRLIYRPYERHCDKCPRRTDGEEPCHNWLCANCGVTFDRVDELPDLDLVVVDEASMVNEAIYKDLSSFGVPVLWIGDHGQLPPVFGSFNLMADPVVRLETIHRQVADSPILQLAMFAREKGWVPFGSRGAVRKRKRSDDWGVDADLVLAGRNETRVALNAFVREIRGLPQDHPVDGDRVVCLKNDYEANVYNGQTGVVRGKVTSARKAWRMRVRLDNDEEITVAAFKEQFGCQTTMRDAPRGAQLWDYGYCLTVHKAQGSEADRVTLLEQRIGNLDYHRRWLYTGITRARRQLEIIGK